MRRWKITFNSPVVLGFVALCFLATLLNSITGGRANELVFMTYHSSLTNPMTYIRFFTHVLGHSNFSHFVGNMTYILLLGPLLEEKYGSKNIITVILVTAVVTGLINYIFFPHTGLCGASGVCFAFILMSSLTSFRSGEIPMTFILVAVVFLGQQVYDGLFADDNISNMAHIFGGIIGGAFGFIERRR